MYIPKVTFRCRPSTFRNVCDSLQEFITDEVKETLKRLNIFQFTQFPPFQQNTPLIYFLLSCWDVSKQAFDIKGHELKFSSDEVSLLTGLPNTGEVIFWEAEPLTSYTGIKIKNEMKNIDKSTSPDVIVNMYIKFLLSNLFFPNNNYRTPKRLISIAENIDEFNNYNWAMSIRDFMVSQFDRLAPKFVNDAPVGYMSGFVPLLMIWFLEHTSILQPAHHEARPRFLRWDSNIFYSAVHITMMFNDLIDKHIFETFQNVTEAEGVLIAAEVFPTPLTFPTHPTLPNQENVPDVGPVPHDSPPPDSPVYNLSKSPEKYERTSEIPEKVAKHQTYSPPAPQFPLAPQLPEENIHDELVHIRAFINILTNELESVNSRVARLESKHNRLEMNYENLRESFFELKSYISDQFDEFKSKIFNLKPDSEHPSTSGLHPPTPADLATTSAPDPPEPEPHQTPNPGDLASSSESHHPNQTPNPVFNQTPIPDIYPATTPMEESLPVYDISPLVISPLPGSGVVDETIIERKGCMDEFIDPDTSPRDETLISEQPKSKKTKTGTIASTVKKRVNRATKAVRTPYTAGRRKTRKGKKEEKNKEEQVDESKPIDVDSVPFVEDHSSAYMEFKGRELISESMLAYMDSCFAKYTEKAKVILTAGNIHVSRGEIDELINEKYLSDAHVDAFCYLLSEKSKLLQGLYKNFLYISSLYYSYAKEKYKDISCLYIKHITREAVQDADYIMYTLCHEKHWTLLVGTVKEKHWSFYDSLPKEAHKDILTDVVLKLHEDVGAAFDTDIRTWPILYPSHVPRQTNSIDCGMFVCKYIEELIKHENVDWKEQVGWQEKMTLFRVELAYAILCSLAK